MKAGTMTAVLVAATFVAGGAAFAQEFVRDHLSLGTEPLYGAGTPMLMGSPYPNNTVVAPNWVESRLAPIRREDARRERLRGRITVEFPLANQPGGAPATAPQ